MKINLLQISANCGPLGGKAFVLCLSSVFERSEPTSDFDRSDPLFSSSLDFSLLDSDKLPRSMVEGRTESDVIEPCWLLVIGGILLWELTETMK